MGEFVGWVESYRSKGDNQIWTIRIRKAIIFAQLKQYKDLRVCRVVWDNGKNSYLKNNSLKFEAYRPPLVNLYGMDNWRVIDSPSTPSTSLLDDLIMSNA